MRYVCLTGMLLLATNASTQEPRRVVQIGGDSAAGGQQAGGDQADESNKIPNPFAKPPQAGAEMGMGGGMSGMMEGGLGEGEMMGMEMGAGMGMGMESVPASPNQLFRRGLQRAIHSLKNAKTDKEKETLRGYVRAAFSNRYDKMISDRKQYIEKLKKSINELENELKRREAAKERVVQLQLQSVQLAAEGLLDLGELQGISLGSPGRGRDSGFEGGGYGTGMYSSDGPNN